ncbi:MAG: hypothetical protein KDA66_14805 [Planctomycetaceae bacterium]|nr:hypothetical protein [Planctomycetaceae bacterium]
MNSRNNADHPLASPTQIHDQRRMPLATTISDIYAAFDAGAHQVFRGAMARSRGGLVRLNDLLAALVDSSSIPDELIPSQWRQLAALESNAPWMTPMSNEPALRDVLRAAHALTESGAEPITPTILFAAALARSQPRPAAATCFPLPLTAHSSVVVPLSGKPKGLNTTERREIIENWFQKWLTGQHINAS